MLSIDNSDLVQTAPFNIERCKKRRKYIDRVFYKTLTSRPKRLFKVLPAAKKPSLPIIQNPLAKLPKLRREGKVTEEEIIVLVAWLHGISVADIFGQRKFRNFVMARHHFYYLAKKYAGLSYPQMSQFLNDRDHTGAMYGDKRWKNFWSKRKHEK